MKNLAPIILMVALFVAGFVSTSEAIEKLSCEAKCYQELQECLETDDNQSGSTKFPKLAKSEGGKRASLEDLRVMKLSGKSVTKNLRADLEDLKDALEDAEIDEIDLCNDEYDRCIDECNGKYVPMKNTIDNIRMG